jgi:hypothetical protein
MKNRNCNRTDFSVHKESIAPILSPAILLAQVLQGSRVCTQGGFRRPPQRMVRKLSAEAIEAQSVAATEFHCLLSTAPE